MSRIKYLVMDVDGTLTDGKIYMGNNGEVFKVFNVKDGYGIHEITCKLDIVPIIITGRNSNILLNRCKEIGIEKVYQGVSDKLKILKKIVSDLSEVAYIGDDVNDLQCMLAVNAAGGLNGCPADAVHAIKKVSDYIASNNGGNGAVRDFIEWIIALDNSEQ